MSNILIILPNNLGDVIMALPVLAALKERDPFSHIAFFVEEGFEGGLVNSPYCDRICRFNRKRVRDLARTHAWRDALVALRQDVTELSEARFDRIINLSQHPYTSYVTALLGGERPTGRIFLRGGNHALPDVWSQYLYTVPFSRKSNSLHATDIYCRIAGVLAPENPARICFDKSETAQARAFLERHEMPSGSGPLWIMQPGAAYAAKRWPLEHYAALGSRLVSDGGSIIVTGAPAEIEFARALGERIGRGVLVTAGKRTFRETLALIPFAHGCVTGDTALMHAAAACAVPVFALFGPTNPVETGPYGPGHHVFYGRCAKRPCFCMDCKNALCMKSILPETVYAAMRGDGTAIRDCDLYVSTVKPGHGIVLEPASSAVPRLFDPMAAAVAQAVVRGAAADLPADGIDAATIKDTLTFIERLDRMVAALTEFLGTRSMEAIRRYEAIHGENRTGGSGITAFYTALLNIRLNGIPLLDPLAGVVESLAVCSSFKAAVERAVGPAS